MDNFFNCDMSYFVRQYRIWRFCRIFFLALMAYHLVKRSWSMPATETGWRRPTNSYAKPGNLHPLPSCIIFLVSSKYTQGFNAYSAARSWFRRFGLTFKIQATCRSHIWNSNDHTDLLYYQIKYECFMFKGHLEWSPVTSLRHAPHAAGPGQPELRYRAASQFCRGNYRCCEEVLRDLL